MNPNEVVCFHLFRGVTILDMPVIVTIFGGNFHFFGIAKLIPKKTPMDNLAKNDEFLRYMYLC
jgi:hypothetical protein